MPLVLVNTQHLEEAQGVARGTICEKRYNYSDPGVHHTMLGSPLPLTRVGSLHPRDERPLEPPREVSGSAVESAAWRQSSLPHSEAEQAPSHEFVGRGAIPRADFT
jgi:hypothetical protein